MATLVVVAHIPWFFVVVGVKKHTHKVHLLVFLLTLLLNGKHTQNKERINYTFSKYLMDAAAQVEKRENMLNGLLPLAWAARQCWFSSHFSPHHEKGIY